MSPHCESNFAEAEKESDRNRQFGQEKVRQRQTHNREKGTKRLKILTDRQPVAAQDIHQDRGVYSPAKGPEDPLILPEDMFFPVSWREIF